MMEQQQQPGKPAKTREPEAVRQLAGQAQEPGPELEQRAQEMQPERESPHSQPEPQPEPAPRNSHPQPQAQLEPQEARGVAYNVTRTPATVACCICGTSIAANPVTMCAPCIATTGNIAESLPRRCELHNCRSCDRYLLRRKVWVAAEWESRELMAVCLKTLKGLSKLKLVDAQFIWTEPHSKRVKIKLTVQDDVYTGTVLEQQCVVEYVIINVQCRICQRAWSKDTWQAVVQLRQKVPHRRTFLYLEQLILTHKADKEALSIKEVKDGMDFFFASKQSGSKFNAFLASVVPTAAKESGRIVGISHHVGTSTTSFSVTVAPICKNDLVYLPKKVRRSLGGIGPLVLCVRVASNLSLLCLTTLEVKELTAAAFFKQAFNAMQSEASLVEYTVLDVEPTSSRGSQGIKQTQKKDQKSASGSSGKRVPGAMIEVALSADFGVNDNTHITLSHLGNILQPGDLVMGYDLGSSNVSVDDELTEEQIANLPSVVLVKKKYRVGKHRRARQRHWKVRQLAVEEPDAAPTKAVERARAEEREAFYQELEEDMEVRSQVALYSTERQRRKTERRTMTAVVPDPGAAAARQEDEDADDNEDAEAVRIPEKELLEYDSEAETEDEDEDVVAQDLSTVLDGLTCLPQPTATDDDDL